MKRIGSLLLVLVLAMSMMSFTTAGAEGEKIVVWTLANDLKQFAEQYNTQVGAEVVEIVVFDSADYQTKVMQTLRTGSTDVDIFVGEPQMLPNFFEAGFAADLSELDAEVSERLVGYTYEVGKDTEGTLRAVSYQATPGSVIYRRDLAIEAFGTDDPAVIGEKFASFGAIVETAAALKEKDYSIFGDTGALRWFSTSSSPWVKDGAIIVDQDRLDYFDAAVELYQKEYVAFAPEWSAAWYASMAGPLPVNAGWSALEEIDASNPSTEIFAYVMPSWGALIVRDNANENKGKFGVCSGVCSFFGGGTFLAVNEFSEKKETAIDFLKFCTLNDDTAQWWLEASNGDVVANKAVLKANEAYQNESFGNQNTYGFYLDELEAIDYSMVTGYDDVCKDAFGAAVVSVQEGRQSKNDALKEFYTVVTAQYPELSMPADAPIE
ncbi:MAG: carbohydrate ABC transporter substrate-binding protein [Clostridiales bacterium]|nr:carbohydrate ABC transporter substrate-binding protein [Clostridiales bacterium]